MYKMALGTDVAAIDLDPIVPQPRSQGVMAARREYTASGGVHEENRYIELVWDAITEEDYASILTQFGLTASLTASVTIMAPEIYYAWNRFNGQVVRPALGEDTKRQNFFVRDVVLLIRNLTYAGG